jgi:hypothetical protein
MSIQDQKVVLYRADEQVTYEFPDQDGGYTGEFQNFYEAVVHGAPVVGTLTQSIRNMEIVTKALRSAESGEVIVLDDSPEPLSADAIPMWMPHGVATLEIEKKESRESRG